MHDATLELDRRRACRGFAGTVACRLADIAGRRCEPTRLPPPVFGVLAGCGGTRKQVRRCRRMIIRTCRRAGLAACLQTTTTTGRSTTTTMPLLSLVGLVPGVGTASDIVVDGTTHRAYVASREFGLSVVNVSTPSAPMVIGASNPPFYGQRVAVAGTLAVGTAGGLGFRVVDLTRPTAPRTVGSLSGTFSGVAFAGTTAYATVAGPRGTAPLVVGST